MPEAPKINLAVFFANKLAEEQWPEIKVDATTYNRDQAVKLVNDAVDGLSEKLPQEEATNLKESAKDLKTNGKRIGQQLLNQYLQKKGLPTQSARSQSLIAGYQQYLFLAQDKLPQLEQLANAVKAAETWDSLFGQKISQAVAISLPDYYSPGLKEQRLKEITNRVETLVGRELQAGRPLDENFSQQVYNSLSRPLAWQAAIVNHQSFRQSLGETIKGASSQKGMLTNSYNTLRNFQMTIDPVYWQVAALMTEAGLSVPETERVITFIQQNVARHASSWELEHYLRTALKRYPQVGDKADFLASRASLYLSRQTPITAKTQNLAKKIKSEDLQAVQLYAYHGWSSQQLQTAGLTELAKEVETLEKNTLVQQVHQKAVEQKQKKWQQLDKAAVKQEKRRQRRHFLATHRRGWLLAPRMRLKMALASSAGWQKFKSFVPKLTPWYWTGQAKRQVYLKTGNFLIRRFGNHFLGKVGQTLLKGGLKGLLKTAAAKIGLGTLLGGPVGTAVGAGLMILGNKNLREVAGSLLTGAGYLLYTLIAKFPLALPLGAVGFVVAGPVGMAIGAAVGAGLSYFWGQTIGSISQVVASSALAKAVVATQTAAGLPAAASSLPVTGITLVSIFAPLGSVVLFTILTSMSLSSALSLPPAKSIGGGISAPKNVVANPSCSHPACQIVALLSQSSCGDGIVNGETLGAVVDCLTTAGFTQATAAFQNSVNNYGSLQCVGFKRGVEPSLPPGNAVSFIDPHKSYYNPNSQTPAVGDNAVWGPRSECSTQDPSAADDLCDQTSDEHPEYLYCCGHIGVVTKVDEYYVDITSAWGDSGAVDTIRISRGAAKNSGGPWQYLNL